MRTSLLKAGDWQKMLGQLKQLLSTIGVESNVEELDSVVTAFGDRLLAGMNYQPQRKFGGKVTLLKADENEATAQLPFDYRLSEVRWLITLSFLQIKPAYILYIFTFRIYSYICTGIIISSQSRGSGFMALYIYIFFLNRFAICLCKLSRYRETISLASRRWPRRTPHCSRMLYAILSVATPRPLVAGPRPWPTAWCSSQINNDNTVRVRCIPIQFLLRYFFPFSNTIPKNSCISHK